MAVSHVYSNAVPDGTATSVVRPSDWNSAHNQYITIAGNTAGASTLSGTNIVFQGGNNLTLSANGQTLIFSGANAGGAQTGISSIVVSDATYTSGQVSFSQGNGISFASGAGQAISITHGLQFTSNTSNITSNALNTNAARVQSVNGSSGAISLNVGSSLSASTNGSSITFGLASNITTALQSAGAYLTTAAQSNHSHNFATTTTNGALVVVGTTNSNGATIGVPPFITTAMASNAATISNINVSAGTTSNNLSALTFNNGNGVTFGLNAGTITASVAAAGGAQTGISGVIASNATFTSGTISFSDANGISFGTGAGQAINITHGLQYTSATSAITSNALHSSASKVAGIIAGTASNGGTATLTGSVSFSNANGISFYTSAGNAVVGTVRTDYQSAGAYLTTAAQSNHSHNFATTTTNGSLMVVATTNSAGATVAVPPYITTYAAQTNQQVTLYATGNTTQSSTGTNNASSLIFRGEGAISVGVSNGSVVVSGNAAAGDGVNIVQMGTTGTTGTTYSASTGTVFINGGNNITVSQNASNQIVISAAQGGIAAGTQTATSGTLVFANSNGVTFGMSGSSQITASVNAGGAAVTLSQWEPFRPIGGGVAFSTMGLNTIYLQRLPADANVQFSYIERRMSGSTVSSTNSQSCRHTYDYGIYSRMTGTDSTQYSLAGSSQLIFMASAASNTQAGYTISQGAASLTNTSAGTGNMASLTGFKHMYFPFTSTITAGGEYAIAFRMSSATTVGTNALRVAFQELSVINNLSIGKIYNTTVIASNASHVGDFAQGVYSATSSNLPNTLALSGLTNAVSQQRMYLQFD